MKYFKNCITHFIIAPLFNACYLLPLWSVSFLLQVNVVIRCFFSALWTFHPLLASVPVGLWCHLGSDLPLGQETLPHHSPAASWWTNLLLKVTASGLLGTPELKSGLIALWLWSGILMHFFSPSSPWSCRKQALWAYSSGQWGEKSLCLHGVLWFQSTFACLLCSFTTSWQNQFSWQTSWVLRFPRAERINPARWHWFPWMDPYTTSVSANNLSFFVLRQENGGYQTVPPLGPGKRGPCSVL